MEVLLLAIANEGLDSIKNEIAFINESLDRAINFGYLKIKEKNNSTYKSLDKEFLRNEDISIIHYTGHSEEDGLVLNEGGINNVLGIDSLKILIQKHNKIKFVFLNSCYSENIASELIKAGVPQVIGTVGKVGDIDSSTVAKKFYEYLGSSTFTISEAFIRTKEYFKKYPNELRDDGDFRSLIISEEREKNVWKLFPEDDSLTPDQKNWTLIPKENLILSDPANEDKIKIFCIYGDDEKSEAFFEKFSFYQDKFHEKRIVNGNLNISRIFSEKSFLEEYNAANIIVNLVTKKFIEFIDQNDILQKIQNFKDKKHCYLPINESEKIFKDIDWIDKTLILEPESDVLTTMFGLDFQDTRRPIDNFDNNFGGFHKIKFERILISNLVVNDYFTLKDTLIDIPISQFDENIYNSNSKLFYHTILEGSQHDGLKLVINKFKNKILKGNNLKYVLNFQTENQVDPIERIESFWINLYNALNTGGNKKIIRTPDRYLSECLEIIFGKMFDIESYADVFLIFDEVNKDLHNSIINSFWGKIIEEFEKNNKEYINIIEEFGKKIEKNENKKDIKFPGRLFVFSINNNLIFNNLSDEILSDERQKLLKFNTNSLSFEPLNYSPLFPLTEEEFRKENWPKLFRFPKLSNMQYQEISDINQQPKRLKIIEKICKKADEKHLISEINSLLNN